MFKGQPLALAWFKSASKPTASLSEELIPGSEDVGEGEDDVLEVGANDQEVRITALCWGVGEGRGGEGEGRGGGGETDDDWVLVSPAVADALSWDC